MISTVTTAASGLTGLTAMQVMTYGVIAVIALIVFLALKEILSAEADRNQKMKSFVRGSNIAIIPLLLVFAAIVAYKVVTIL